MGEMDWAIILRGVTTALLKALGKEPSMRE